MRLFVLCPAAYATGGPEALHQLVYHGTLLGYDARIVYYPEGVESPTHPRYAKYAVPVAQQVVDAPDAVVVAPETDVHLLGQYRYARRALWWLSVDNFLTRSELLRRHAGTPTSPLEVVFDDRAGFVHLAQSEYARRFLASRGCRPGMLTDYIASEVTSLAETLADASPRRRLVAYNPAKGLPFTERLMEATAGRVDWVPLVDMTSTEVASCLSRTMVYVDFGGHPGRDRIPREAVLLGNCLVVGSRGSASNEIDVPVPEGYRVDEDEPDSVSQAVSVIERALDNHGQEAARFLAYRSTIAAQERTFQDEVFSFAETMSAQHAATTRWSA
jgi:hypothetical protein